MFCDACGTAVQPGQAFCSKCGKQIVGPISVAGPRPGRVQSHLQLLGILWLAISAFNAVGGLILLVLANTLFSHLREMNKIPPDVPVGFLTALFSTIGIIILAKAACGFITGWGLSGAMLGLVALQRHLPPYAAPLATSLVATAANIFGGAVQPLIGYAVGVRPRGELLTIFQSSNPDFGTAQRGLILVLVSVLLALIASFCFRPAPSQAEPAG